MSGTDPSEPRSGGGGPRVLHVELRAESAPNLQRTASPRSAWASLGGSGLAVDLAREHLADLRAEGFLCVTVGRGVRRGLPTAARATVAGRACLGGRYAEGQVGGDLAARLAGFADALVLTGRCEGPGKVLSLGPRGTVELLDVPELIGLDPEQTQLVLEQHVGACASLIAGPAGRRGARAAVLTAGSTGAPASRVGRGGLGARLGALGLDAVCVHAPAPPTEPESEGATRLRAALLRSPRLEARAEGGTLELFAARALEGHADFARVGERLREEARERRVDRHGCRGCPTPCGYRFRSKGGEARPARFGALRALGLDLGGGELGDALALLERCDRLGVDAKEVGAALAVLARGLGEPPVIERLAAWLDAAASGDGASAVVLDGAAATAQAHGRGEALRLVQDQTVPDEPDAARRLALCVSTGGVDPMRAFAFDAGALASATGSAVAWHEDLSAALDSVGFCAFSAAALLGDGLVELDELAALLLEREGPGAGEALLAHGERVVLARRDLDEQLVGPRALPSWAEADLAREWDDYRAARGLDERGALSGETRDRLAGAVHSERSDSGKPRRPRRREHRERRPGVLRMRANGPLGEALVGELGPDGAFDLALPCSCLEVARELAHRAPALAGRLVAGERLVPAVWRRGVRLSPEDTVEAHDELVFVTAVAGG